jgi:hypothetical protein
MREKYSDSVFSHRARKINQMVIAIVAVMQVLAIDTQTDNTLDASGADTFFAAHSASPTSLGTMAHHPGGVCALKAGLVGEAGLQGTRPLGREVRINIRLNGGVGALAQGGGSAREGRNIIKQQPCPFKQSEVAVIKRHVTKTGIGDAHVQEVCE